MTSDPLILSDEGEEAFASSDVGLAAERTDLAWSRSGLALIACGVIIARGLPSLDANQAKPIVGAVVLVLGVITWLVGLVSAHHRRHGLGEERATARLSDVAPVALGTAVVGAAGLVLAAFHA